MVTPIECKSSKLRYADLEKQIWREIYLMMDYRLLKDQLKKQAKESGDKLSDDYASQKVKDIQYCLKQSNDYFTSSKSATLVIKPTLIYYGIVSLAAALIIFKKRDKALNSMREAHGLKDKYPKEMGPSLTINRDHILSISAELMDSGTFTEIAGLDMAERFSLLIKGSGKPDATKDYKQTCNFLKQYTPPLEINLLTLFQNIPEIWKEVKLTLKKEALTYEGEAVANGSFVTCRISKELNSVEELKKNFSFISHSQVMESNDYFFFKLPTSIYSSHTPLTKIDSNGTQFLVANNNNPLISNDFIIYYLTFFILGSLSRYKPVLWREVLENPLCGLNTIPGVLCESAYVKMPLHFINEVNDNFYKI